ncbi:flagellin [Pontivivens insulae]|uniref:Flagellin n=1 Tax=Pontivivens insulae TaxID=1639689 RepID=A0A2R8A9D5_9RHOB|nr:flagellin [Pontivivens insulae]RED12760.1 flagellin [Pontivivens insulae]SPF28851.1 Flagellin [Pontivivens insulae]
MSSILTNTSAMVALDTLRGINRSLSETQSQISTGLKVSSAKDNAAVWSISQAMQTDIDGFSAIQDNLMLGNSTVSVAREAAESVVELMGEVKKQVLAAQESGNDKAKIQTEINALRDQVESIVNAAQFNGVNLLKGTEAITVLSSLDRDASGDVTPSRITVNRVDLAPTVETAGTTDITTSDLMTGTGTGSTFAGNAGTPEAAIAFVDAGVTAGATYEVQITGSGAAGADTGGLQTFTYIASDTDTRLDVSNALKSQIDTYISDNSLTLLSTSQDATTGELTIALGGGQGTDNLLVDLDAFSGGVRAGGLTELGSMDVTTTDGAVQALSDVEALLTTAIDAAASFGSVQGRIETQSDFIGSLKDSLTTGRAALVDANMEETSARLQALQVQQQLGIQSLSIANQAPQNILALFR